MKIQLGLVKMQEIKEEKVKYPLANKTHKYLTPVLKEYGEEFINKYNTVFKIAIGIGDIVVENRKKFTYEKHLFMLIDTQIAGTKKFFISFLEWLHLNTEYYETDYVFGNIQKSTYHMIVLKFPKKFYNAFETFKLGRYSKMYDQEAIEKYFENHPDAKKVLIKDNNYRLEFLGELNEMFGSSLEEKDMGKDWEYDLPPTDKSDKFNHHLKKKDK